MAPQDLRILAFLRACLQSRWHPPARAAAAALAQSPGWDWDAITDAAMQGRVAPLLYDTLKAASWVPGEVLQSLHRAYLLTAARNIAMHRELVELLAALSQAGIPHLVLKGAVLGQNLYNNLALRPFGDLDVLVRDRDALAARETAAALGYATVGTPMHRHPGPAFLLKEVHMYKQGSPGEAANLDLHWHLFKPPVVQEAQTPDWFWETARPALIHETPTLTLGPEAQLLYLSTHVGEQHAEGMALGSLHTLLWLADIATVIAANGAAVDWTEVVARAESYGLQAPVRAVLVHLAQHWAAPIPEPTVTALAHLRAPTRKDQTLDLLTAEAPVTGHLHRSYFVTLVGLKSWASRLQFVAHAGFPSLAYMRERYKVRRPILTPLFYLYRGFVGLRSLGLTTWMYLRQRIGRAGRRTP